jgi:hypothetical protein
MTLYEVLITAISNVLEQAQCLMASKTRIDEFQSLRMFVFQERDEKKKAYFGRPMLTVEREKLMGFPVGYVEIPGRLRSVM